MQKNDVFTTEIRVFDMDFSIRGSDSPLSTKPEPLRSTPVDHKELDLRRGDFFTEGVIMFSDGRFPGSLLNALLTFLMSSVLSKGFSKILSFLR